MRSFIAIPLNRRTHSELLQLQDKLRKSHADIKWVKPENIHLTLKFLGDIDESQATQIKTTLTEVSKRHNPFSMHLSSLGTFPKLSSPRVVWVGIDEGQQECKTLQKSVEDALEKLGFEKENRKFTAHLTLGRVRSDKNKSQFINLLEENRDFSSKTRITVERIILFQSTLSKEGSIYAPLSKHIL